MYLYNKKYNKLNCIFLISKNKKQLQKNNHSQEEFVLKKIKKPRRNNSH